MIQRRDDTPISGPPAPSLENHSAKRDRSPSQELTMGNEPCLTSNFPIDCN